MYASNTFGSILTFIMVVAQFWLLLDVGGGLRTRQLWSVHTRCLSWSLVWCRGWTPHKAIVALATLLQ